MVKYGMQECLKMMLLIEEIDIQKFAHNLNKSVEDVYPYTYEIED